MEEVVRSLCEGGIQVSLSALPSSIAGFSATPPVVSHRGGGSAQPSRPPQAASLKGGASAATRPPPKEEGTTQVPTRDGGDMASNYTKTTRDEAARILESFMLYTWGAVSTSSGVLVAGEASWVTQVAVWDQILVLYPTHGRVEKHSLVPHIRLAAKVILLERNEFQPGNGSVGGGGAEHDNASLSSCSFFIEQATLLNGGVYTFRTGGCWLRNHTLFISQPLLPETRSLRGAPVAVVIIKVGCLTPP
ncbi:hypothetical protein E2C01_010564 [Portunus trituberculatus]|uniref:Uncharacterized protein n=1 Tax=Portunus trituberculatus TaxID=210409 RepID=A0A5B7D8S9_PORTR|nr:hypothetical protein [Portunus trituberculatus]